MTAFLRAFGACILALASALAQAGAIGAVALRARHDTLAPQLAQNAFGAPLLLQSQESARRVEGEVYAVIDHPFDRVAAVLGDPGQWCDILILHLNTKMCRRTDANGIPRIDLYVGKKEPQPPEQATLLTFLWRPSVKRADYLSAQMEADEGPYATRDYLILVEAVPIDAGHTFVHMGYGFSYGGASSVAMKLYLSTIGRNKVGFTRDGDASVGGVRGIAERNTMRYYLAIAAYLDSLALPRDRQVDRRIAQWFDATERYARQLHELDRDEYLTMKRDEIRRQAAAH
jgi:hypothetical protein